MNLGEERRLAVTCSSIKTNNNNNNDMKVTVLLIVVVVALGPVPKGLEKENRRTGDPRKNQDHPDHSTVKNRLEA